MTLNIRPSEEPMPVDGPVRVLYSDGHVLVPGAFSPEEWARRLAPRETPTDWFPERLSPVSACGTRYLDNRPPRWKPETVAMAGHIKKPSNVRKRDKPVEQMRPKRTCDQCGRRIYRAEHAQCSRCRRIKGRKPRIAVNRRTDVTPQLIFARWRDGKSALDIAAELSCNPKLIYRCLKEAKQDPALASEEQALRTCKCGRRKSPWVEDCHDCRPDHAGSRRRKAVAKGESR